MPFCHIYARGDGRYRVRMHGTVTRADRHGFLGGTVQYVSKPFDTEYQARWWIEQGRQRDGLEDMPGPRVIRRSAA